MSKTYTIRHYGKGGLLDTETVEDAEDDLTIAQLLRNDIGRTIAADGDRIEIALKDGDHGEPDPRARS